MDATVTPAATKKGAADGGARPTSADAGLRDAGKPTDPGKPTDAGKLSDATNLADADSPADAQAHDASSAMDASPYAADAASEWDAAAPPPPADAGAAQDMDAASPSDLDAAAPANDAASGDAGASRQCVAGSEHGGYCWFLGAQGLSCEQVCESHAGYEASLEWVGSIAQGGSLARCDELLTLLTGPGTTDQGTRWDKRGLGCHLYSGRRWWLYTPGFNETANEPNASIVCSCFDL